MYDRTLRFSLLLQPAEEGALHAADARDPRRLRDITPRLEDGAIRRAHIVAVLIHRRPALSTAPHTLNGNRRSVTLLC